MYPPTHTGQLREKDDGNAVDSAAYPLPMVMQINNIIVWTEGESDSKDCVDSARICSSSDVSGSSPGDR